MTSLQTRGMRIAGASAAAVGLAAALAACSGPAEAAGDQPDTSPEYTDGSYEADGSYISPAGSVSVHVAVTLEADLVTAVTVTPQADDPQALGFQKQFASGVAAAVVGKDIDTLDVSRVAGSSLTSGGFQQAIEAIKAEAAVS